MSVLRDEYFTAPCSFLQEDGEKSEKEKAEQENLGKLEFSVDYNFTDGGVLLETF